MPLSMPGSGSVFASASTASRAARERRRQGWTVSVPRRVATSRRSLPRRGRRRARPAGSRARAPLGLRDHELAIGSLEQEVRVAAREEPRGGGRAGRRGTPARPARGSRRRRSVFAPGSASAERLERRAALPPVRSPPTARTPQAWWDRRRAGIGVRARDGLSRGSISGGGTVQTTGALAPSQRIRTLPVGAAYRRRLGLCRAPARLRGRSSSGRRGRRAGGRP